MKRSFSKSLVAVALAAVMVTTGCTADWLKVALADLPVLVQMALNIASLVGTLKDGGAPSAEETALINKISTEAATDLQLLQKLYGDYKAQPNASALQKIQDAIATTDTNLQALLNAGHIANPLLAARVVAAVNLILTTVNSFAALLPQPAPVGGKVKAHAPVHLATPGELKARWNAEVYPQF